MSKLKMKMKIWHGSRLKNSKHASKRKKRLDLLKQRHAVKLKKQLDLLKQRLAVKRKKQLN